MFVSLFYLVLVKPVQFPGNSDQSQQAGGLQQANQNCVLQKKLFIEKITRNQIKCYEFVFRIEQEYFVLENLIKFYFEFHKKISVFYIKRVYKYKLCFESWF